MVTSLPLQRKNKIILHVWPPQYTVFPINSQIKPVCKFSPRTRLQKPHKNVLRISEPYFLWPLVVWKTEWSWMGKFTINGGTSIDKLRDRFYRLVSIAVKTCPRVQCQTPWMTAAPTTPKAKCIASTVSLPECGFPRRLRIHSTEWCASKSNENHPQLKATIIYQ